MKSGNRLFSLDLLRGLDMFYLACVSVVLKSAFRTWPDFFGAFPRIGGQSFTTFFGGHPWYGFTLYDLIMPLFIFMSGAAVPFAIPKRLDNGRPTASYWRHLVWRLTMLWSLGLLAQGYLERWDLSQLYPYSNTLQAIAVGYLAAALVLLIPRLWARIAIPVALLVGFGLLVHFGGDYTKEGNLCQLLELKFYAAVLPGVKTAVPYITKYGYVWLLPSLMFPVLALGGMFSTQLLRREGVGEWRKARDLLGYGGGCLLAGLLLEWCGVKCVKHFFSVSFTLQAIGWSVLALDALYVLTDIFRFRRGTGLFVLFGQFALAAYLCEAVFRNALIAVWRRLVAFPTGEFVEAIGYSVLVVAVVLIRRRIAQAGVPVPRGQSAD